MCQLTHVPKVRSYLLEGSQGHEIRAKLERAFYNVEFIRNVDIVDHDIKDATSGHPAILWVEKVKGRQHCEALSSISS